jgi:Arc/MetJ-type ribon-helix-helix transcriptional regulator
MSEFIVRLKGQQDNIVNDFIKEGIFSNKTEVVRAGILELYNKYHNLLNKENEMMLKIAKKIDKDGGKSISEEEFLKKFSHLK